MRGTLYFDGSARPNPGDMKIGFVLKVNGDVVRVSKEMGEGTNNVAEYLALLEGLKKALEMGIDEIDIYGDSTLVIEQIRGNFRVRNPRLKELHSEVVRLLGEFKKWRIEWIPEDENREAHELSQ